MSAFGDTLKGLNKAKTPEKIDVIKEDQKIIKEGIPQAVNTAIQKKVKIPKISRAKRNQKMIEQGEEPTKLKTFRFRVNISKIVEVLSSFEERSQQEIIEELIIGYAKKSLYKDKVAELLG